eukprot:TRINITY_DN1405_c0_g1_i2.p1 TRINITY_DN1405_c0_g1~~TRINITY_DN1405_c0_g1_i2.p1  ORF type:complete len:225 (-),score=77.87 TRINITY_DN1405_c0_g1_i2:192-866(-)
MAPRKPVSAAAAFLAAGALVLLGRCGAPSLGFTAYPALSSKAAGLERASGRQAASLLDSAGASPAGSAASSSYAAGAAAVGVALVAAFVACGRDESLVQMFARHDRRTFRGKQHNHTFGKFRLRKNKWRRLRDIRTGEYDPENIPQRGQPEPRHCWDGDILLNNPMVYTPQYAKDVIQDCIDNAIDNQRANWQRQMGKYGKQMAFENWTPPQEGKKEEKVEAEE